MECWANPDKSITPVLQFFNSPAAIDTRLSYPLRHALRALLSRRGPAAEENSRIGYISNTDRTREAVCVDAIRLALREHGHLQGQKIAIEYRYAEAKPDRYTELAAELVHLKVDIILVSTGS